MIDELKTGSATEGDAVQESPTPPYVSNEDSSEDVSAAEQSVVESETTEAATEEVAPVKDEKKKATKVVDKAKELSDSVKLTLERARQKAEENPALRWYIVHCYSMFEHRAKLALQDRIDHSNHKDKFGEILVPTESVVELVRGQKRQSERKFFPGYMLVQMVVTDETWHIVKGTTRVTGFVGGVRKPPPLPMHEVERLTQQMLDGAAKAKPRFRFKEGDSVKVVDGPFSNFNGTVEEVKPEKSKLRVLVSIFGRATPVELDFIQVKKN